jgi:hypothetical protein
MQAGFKPDQVQVSGRFNAYSRISDEADRKERVFHFCPDCGSQGIGMWEGCREMAKEDSDFDPIRDEATFTELVS